MTNTSLPTKPTTSPKPSQVFEDPVTHWAFLTAGSDNGFEGQHFDRKEAGRPEADGTVPNAKLKNVREQIEECISAFANASGGLLVLGISTNGTTSGLGHLSEEQLNTLLRFDRLLYHNCQIRLYDVPSDHDGLTRIGLFLVPPAAAAICETAQNPPKAWIRQGLQNIPLTDAARDRLKRDRRIVDFERMACSRFNIGELDTGVLQEFKDSYLSIASYEWVDEELLYQVGAISRESEPDAWTNAGMLFFSANPQRVLPHANIRLLRFETSVAARDERPPPTYDKSFTGSLTKQIRDFRTFMQESAFFKTFQRRKKLAI